jgi:hypothetical protein
MNSVVTVVRIYLFAFGVFCVMAGVYYLLQDSTGFDRMMHGKSPKKQEKQRSLEDFIVSMQRVCPPFSPLLTMIGFHPTRDYGIDGGKNASVENSVVMSGRQTFVL